LQRKAREQGCSVFVNADFVPYPDQWSYLATIGTVEVDEIGPIVARLAPGYDVLDVAFEYEEGEEPWKRKLATTEKMSALGLHPFKWYWRTGYTSGRKSYPRPFSTGSSDWLPSRIRNSTRRRR